jgi:hypothetical protein
VSDVIGSAKRSSQIAWIGGGDIEGSWEGRNMSEMDRKCRRESRDDVERQWNIQLSENPKSELSDQQNGEKKKARKLENQNPRGGLQNDTSSDAMWSEHNHTNTL